MTLAETLPPEAPKAAADLARPRATAPTPQPAPPPTAGDEFGGPVLPRHREASAAIAASAELVFLRLDDQTRLAEHMSRPSMMMAAAG